MHGALPALDKMVSTVITSPPSGARITSGKIHPNGISFTIVSTNMEFGHTDDPATQYQSKGQILNEKGLIKGHSHLVIQRLSNSESPPSPLEKDLVFFQSLGREHQPSSVDGETLRVVAKKELFTVPGIYRACTITTSSANTPVIMPIERRGPQDDCIRFNILA
ncbi:hypothetical protein BKA69DRAFT_1085432 [Paraphysoderma sedebokerense]|nr:hypothetical protein BKA69DRAFT_1085432 [Paraphysoderma sedebokerense]